MCLICDRIEMIKNGNNPYFVKELETGYVVIGDNQHFYGQLIIQARNSLQFLWEEDKLVFHGTAEKFRNHYTFKELLDS